MSNRRLKILFTAFLLLFLQPIIAAIKYLNESLRYKENLFWKIASHHELFSCYAVIDKPDKYGFEIALRIYLMPVISILFAFLSVMVLVKIMYLGSKKAEFSASYTLFSLMTLFIISYISSNGICGFQEDVMQRSAVFDLYPLFIFFLAICIFLFWRNIPRRLFKK